MAHQRQSVTPQPPDTTLACGVASPRVLPTWMARVTIQTRFIAAIACLSSDERSTDAVAILDHDGIRLLNGEWAARARDLRVHPPIVVDRCPVDAAILHPTYARTVWGDVIPMRITNCGDNRVGHFQFVPSNKLDEALDMPVR